MKSEDEIRNCLNLYKKHVKNKINKKWDEQLWVLVDTTIHTLEWVLK